MDHHHKLGILLLCLLASSLFYLCFSVEGIDLQKILGQKYYLHRDVAFGSYLKLDPDAPTRVDPFIATKLMAVGLNDLPYAWITPQAPRNYTLNLAYCFKFAIYANCSRNIYGYFVASFWRWRDGSETKLYTVRPGSDQIRAEPLRPITWFEWINATLRIQEGDRLIFKLQVYSFAAGRYWMGLDCVSLASYINDPYTETLRPSADGTNASNEWPSGSSVPPPHYDKVDEVVSDGDTTFIATDEITITVKQNNFLKPATGILSMGIIDSLTVYIQAKYVKDVGSTVTTSANVGLHNTSSGADNYPSSFTLTASYANYSYTWSADPFTSKAWVVADIVKVETQNRGQSNRVRVGGIWRYTYAYDTQTWLVVEFHYALISFEFACNIYPLSSLTRTYHTLSDSLIDSVVLPGGLGTRNTYGFTLSDTTRALSTIEATFTIPIVILEFIMADVANPLNALLLQKLDLYFTIQDRVSVLSSLEMSLGAIIADLAFLIIPLIFLACVGGFVFILAYRRDD